jgi:hypothetical protein
MNGRCQLPYFERKVMPVAKTCERGGRGRDPARGEGLELKGFECEGELMVETRSLTPIGRTHRENSKEKDE